MELVLTSTTTGTARAYEWVDQLVADVEDARVWGGLHFRTTMTRTAAHFPQIARDVGREHFLAHQPDGGGGSPRDQDDD